MKNLLHFAKTFWSHLIIGGILLYFDYRFLLFYIFILILDLHESINSYINTYVNAILSNQNSNRMRLRALLRKSNIDTKDIERIIREAEHEMGSEQHDLFQESFRKDFR